MKIEPILQRPKFGPQEYKITHDDGRIEVKVSHSGGAGSLVPFEPVEEPWTLEEVLKSPLFKKIKRANSLYRLGKNSGYTDAEYDGMVGSLRLYYPDFQDLL